MVHHFSAVIHEPYSIDIPQFSNYSKKTYSDSNFLSNSPFDFDFLISFFKGPYISVGSMMTYFLASVLFRRNLKYLVHIFFGTPILRLNLEEPRIISCVTPQAVNVNSLYSYAFVLHPDLYA